MKSVDPFCVWGKVKSSIKTTGARYSIIFLPCLVCFQITIQCMHEIFRLNILSDLKKKDKCITIPLGQYKRNLTLSCLSKAMAFLSGCYLCLYLRCPGTLFAMWVCLCLVRPMGHVFVAGVEYVDLCVMYIFVPVQHGVWGTSHKTCMSSQFKLSTKTFLF